MNRVAPPKRIPLAEADRLLGLPAGVAQSWVNLGLVRMTLYVHKGTIIQGVYTTECRRLVDARRARRVTLSSRRTVTRTEESP